MRRLRSANPFLRFSTTHTEAHTQFQTQFKLKASIHLIHGRKSVSHWRPPLPQWTTKKASRMARKPPQRKKTCEDVIRFINRPNNEPALSFTHFTSSTRAKSTRANSPTQITKCWVYKWQASKEPFAPRGSKSCPCRVVSGTGCKLDVVIAQSLGVCVTCIGCFNHTYLTLINID